MITPMLKYQFLAFYKDVDKLLDLLKDLGVVHVKQLKKEVDEETGKLKRQKMVLKQYQGQFYRYTPDEEPKAPTLKAPTLDDFSVENCFHYLDELEDLEKSIPRLKEELYHIRFFGNYDQEKLKELQERGLYFHLFSIGKGKIKKEWRKEYPVEELFTSGRKTYFCILTNTYKTPEIKAQTEDFPSRSAKEVEQLISEQEKRKNSLAKMLFVKQDAIQALFDQKFIHINDSLQDKRAEDQLVKMGFGKVCLLQGWIPVKKEEILDAALNAAGFYYEKQKPLPKDSPPIELKNSSIGKWFEPIAKLFALPKYSELDLTPFFAPFFLLFFGFCLGDGGYGLLVFLVLLALYPKVPKPYKNIWKLAVVIEFLAFPIGVLSGTFFGINLFETDLPPFTSLRPYMFDSEGLFNLALMLGAIQIFFGLILKAINQTKQYSWQHALSPIGWMILLSGVGYGYLEGFSLLAKITSWTGVVLVIIFSDPNAGIGTRLGKGLWDLYGITGFFGDLLSYIRLFALGLAGSILGFVVNDIALTILDSHAVAGPIFFVIMLIVGHGLNIFIASLGAFVHPMRLTFVEFYKNAGFTGGGEAYQPLQKLKPKTHKL